MGGEIGDRRMLRGSAEGLSDVFVITRHHAREALFSRRLEPSMADLHNSVSLIFIARRLSALLDHDAGSSIRSTHPGAIARILSHILHATHQG